MSIVSHAQECNYWFRLTQYNGTSWFVVMGNTVDKLNELEGPYYDSGTVRALQELENRVKIQRDNGLHRILRKVLYFAYRWPTT